jgi:tetratricopeptide (TPR) repeat protein
VSGLTTADRVVALLEWGDIAEADNAIAAADPEGPDGWQAFLWQGARALMEGRFDACDRLASAAAEHGQAAGEPRARMLGTLLLVGLRREQQRPAEAEIVLRMLVDQLPAAPAGAHAVLASLLGEMGRDAHARQELVRLLPADPVPATGRLGALFQLAELASDLDAPEEADLLHRRLLPHAADYAVEEGGAVFYGCVSLPLGRLAQALGRWGEAVAHFERAAEAHTRVGAPLLLAHTQRHLAALLRTRGAEGDWERGLDLLDSAATIYRLLGVDRLAAEAQMVLARSEDGWGSERFPDELGDGPYLFRRQDDGWVVGLQGQTTRLRDAQGLRDIARLLMVPDREVHVFDLLETSSDSSERSWAPRGIRPWPLNRAVLDQSTRAEYEARLAELAGELVEAERAGDAIRAALVRAERDALNSGLSEGEVGDPQERACRVVSTRIRISVDHVERAHPALGHHLRRSIRTGTFCSYQPARRLRWAL